MLCGVRKFSTAAGITRLIPVVSIGKLARNPPLLLLAQACLDSGHLFGACLANLHIYVPCSAQLIDMSSAEESPPEAKPLSEGEQAYRESYGSIHHSQKPTTWEAEYASPWMILFNTLALVGYQIVSLGIVAYQVFIRRHYIMSCFHSEHCTATLWACEYTKAFTRFFPLVAILISMSLARSMILIQRMYYELLRNGAVLQFKTYTVRREPVFYILVFCFVQGASNWLLDALTPGHDVAYWTEPSYSMTTTQKLRQWLIYLVLPMTTFILSVYFMHEPSYYLVPLSRYLHASTPEGSRAAQQSLADLILVREEFVAPAAKHIELAEVPSDDLEAANEATRSVYQELIKTAQELENGGSVMVGKKRMAVLKSQITDRFWPAKLLFNEALADATSPLGIALLDFCLYKTQEDIKHITVI